MFESKLNRGKANGYAPLDGSGKVPLSKLPSIQSTINTGSLATTGSNTFVGDQTINGSVTTTTGNIQGTGSLYLQPDSNDNRHFEIYNTSPTDVHIKSNSGLSFFGDDTNYLKIDDSAGDVTIAAFSDIILTTDDGGVYIGSYGSNNGVVTNGYLNTIIGDTDIINGGTGNSITDVIGRIPTVDTGSFATTSSLQALIDVTGSFVTTSSFNEFTSSTITNSQTSSFVKRTSIPTSLTGSVGDRSGMIAFNSEAVYFANDSYYGTGPFTTSLYENTDSSPNIPITKGNYPKPKIGWTINILNGFLVATITNVVEYTNYWLVYTDGGNASLNAGNSVTLTANGLFDNIWLKQEFISSSIIDSLNSKTGSYATTGSNSFNGNQTITGSVTATSFVGNGSQLTNVAIKTTGTWTVPPGASTRSFTVDWNRSYQMWVIGNIPNGIISWNASVNVTNANVPVVGNQYGWYYPEGNALVLTSIPPQIVGVNGAISTTAFSTTTSNTFEFGITNNSGTSQEISWGYITL